MTKDEFIELNVIDKIKYINAELKTGKKVLEVRKNLGVSEKDIQKLMKDNSYKYNQKLKQYIPTTENTTVATTNSTTQTTTESTTMDLQTSEVNIGKNTLLTVENANTLDYLSSNMDILIDIIEKYKTTTATTTGGNYITIDLVDDKHLKPKPKSIRINEFVYQDWQKFCEKQHHSKMDLISMALKEYMEKYN